MANTTAYGYLASTGYDDAGDLKQLASSAASAGSNGSTSYLNADGSGKLAGGESLNERKSVTPIYKIFYNNMADCPSTRRRVTYEEATRVKAGLISNLGEWDIIKLAGGKVTGSGYSNEMTPGYFDDGFGWVFTVQAGFNHYEKIFINSLDDIPDGWRRATIEEMRSGPTADAIRKSLGEWDIIKLAGGKMTGPGYGSTLEPGYFDNGVGWVYLVSQS